MTGSGSPVVRRRLGITLRELRVASGKSVKDVMLARIASKAKMSRLETGKVEVRSADLLVLCKPRDWAAHDREWTRLLGRAVPVGEWPVSR